MFMTSWYYALLAMGMAGCIYKYIEYRGLVRCRVYIKFLSLKVSLLKVKHPYNVLKDSEIWSVSRTRRQCTTEDRKNLHRYKISAYRRTMMIHLGEASVEDSHQRHPE
jgi:hypothetical protein